MKREIKFRAWHTAHNKMYEHKDLSVLAKNIADDNIWKFMQYTGLKDRYNYEMYEGDICRLNRSSWLGGTFEADGAIEWHYDRFLWKRLPKYDGDEDNGVWPTCEIFAGHTWIEVIGNIYENPDLLT